eukprot:gene8807-biopygen22661
MFVAGATKGMHHTNCAHKTFAPGAKSLVGDGGVWRRHTTAGSGRWLSQSSSPHPPTHSGFGVAGGTAGAERRLAGGGGVGGQISCVDGMNGRFDSVHGKTSARRVGGTKRTASAKVPAVFRRFPAACERFESADRFSTNVLGHFVLRALHVVAKHAILTATSAHRFAEVVAILWSPSEEESAEDAWGTRGGRVGDASVPSHSIAWDASETRPLPFLPTGCADGGYADTDGPPPREIRAGA